MAQSGRAVRFGVHSGPQDIGWPELAHAWREVEAMGFDRATVFDHLMPISGDFRGPCYEGWTALAALSQVARRMRVGIIVSDVTLRHPALLARMAVTVDHASEGRLDVGLGAGNPVSGREHAAFAMPFPRVGVRIRQLEEALTLIRSLWAQPSTTFEGRYFRAIDAPCEPKPLQRPHPPLIVGASNPRMIGVAARHADEWNMFGGPEAARQKGEIFDRAAAEAGRDTSAVTRSVNTPLLLASGRQLDDLVARIAQQRRTTEDNVRTSMLCGDAPQIVEQVRRYVEAGVTSIAISVRRPIDLPMLRQFAEQVIPAFR